MCNGFGIIVDQELNLWFSEPDYGGDCSHSITIERLGWQENGDVLLRHFVRVQFPDWTPGAFAFDEDKTLPSWCENARGEIREKCEALLLRCAPACAEYEKVRAPARAEYDKVCDAARAKYEKVRDAACAEYEKVRAPARAKYEKVRAPARAKYEKVRDAARAELITAWTSILGYVPKKG